MNLHNERGAPLASAERCVPVVVSSRSLFTNAFLFSSSSWLGIRPALPPSMWQACEEKHAHADRWASKLTSKSCKKNKEVNICTFDWRVTWPATSWGPPGWKSAGCHRCWSSGRLPYKESGYHGMDRSRSDTLRRPEQEKKEIKKRKCVSITAEKIHTELSKQVGHVYLSCQGCGVWKIHYYWWIGREIVHHRTTTLKT